jgi:iron(III) transport system substrate-binding protein
MISRRTFTLAGMACVATAGCGLEPYAEKSIRRLTPGHSRLEAAASKEGALRIGAAAGPEGGFQELFAAFARLHPAIELEFHRPTSRELSAQFLREVAGGRPTADILISSAMDLQFKLVNDDYARPYDSPQKAHLPDWAVWKDQAYAITAEPIAFVYNRALMPPEDVPGSHDALADLLRRKPREYRGRIATYDPARSGTGYFYYTQDLLLSHDTLDLVAAVGRTNPGLYISGGIAVEKVMTGEHLLAYNMVSSYNLERQAHNSNVGIVYPSDYTLVISHIALIPRTARHPAAAGLFLDFALSEAGQAVLAGHFMRPIRTGVPMAGPLPSSDVLRPVHFGPSLLASLDEFRRQSVLREWRRAIGS